MGKDIEAEIFLKGGKKFSSDLKKTGKDAEKTSKSFGKLSVSIIAINQGIQLFSGFARAAGRAIGALIEIGTEAVNAASDFEEANQKFGVVFSTLRRESIDTRDQLARDFGLSRLAATELLASTGDLLTGFGFAQSSALKLSKEVNVLAADLASFANLQGGAARASEILTKALLGEKDSLVALGVKILDSDVQLRLLRDGHDKLTGSALRQAKAQVTLALIYEQTKNAQGDFARSSDSLANQQRTLEARLSDLEVLLGDKLVPITKIFIAELIVVAEKTIDWVEANKQIFSSELITFAKTFANIINFIAQTVVIATQAFFLWSIQIVAIKAVFSALGLSVAKVFKVILKGASEVTNFLVLTFREAVGKVELVFLEMIAALTNNPISDAVISEKQVALIEARIAILRQSTEGINKPITGENAFSKQLNDSIFIIDKFTDTIKQSGAAQIEDVRVALERVASLQKVSEALTKVNAQIQKGLDLRKAEIDTQTPEEFKKSEEDNSDAREKAEAQAELEQALLAEKTLSEQAFTEFFKETQLQRELAVTERADREREGLSLKNDELIASGIDTAATLAAIARKEEDEIFKIRQQFKDKTISLKSKEAEEKEKILQREKQQTLRATANLFGGLAALTASAGAKAFKITQGLRIGEAIMNTYAAANQAMASLPYPANVIAAVASVAQGLANVNTIRQQKPPTRAQHGIDIVGRSEQPAILHLGETVLNRQETSELRDLLDNRQLDGGGGGGGVNVTIQIENFQMLADDDKAIGVLTTAIRRNLQEQNLEAIQ